MTVSAPLIHPTPAHTMERRLGCIEAPPERNAPQPALHRSFDHGCHVLPPITTGAASQHPPPSPALHRSIPRASLQLESWPPRCITDPALVAENCVAAHVAAGAASQLRPWLPPALHRSIPTRVATSIMVTACCKASVTVTCAGMQPSPTLQWSLSASTEHHRGPAVFAMKPHRAAGVSVEHRRAAGCFNKASSGRGGCCARRKTSALC